MRGERCARCRFSGSEYKDRHGECKNGGCNYIIITGKSRLEQVYKRLGVEELTEEAARLMEPKHCPFFEQGEEAKTLTRPQQGRMKWDEKKALALWRAGKCDRDIAEALGVTKNAIGNWRRRHGMAVNKEESASQEAVRRMVGEGLSAAEIGKRLGLSSSDVSYHRKRLGLKKEARG